MSKRIVQRNGEVIKGELSELVRNRVEETLNDLLSKEAEQLINATQYERSKERQGGPLSIEWTEKRKSPRSCASTVIKDSSTLHTHTLTLLKNMALHHQLEPLKLVEENKVLIVIALKYYIFT